MLIAAAFYTAADEDLDFLIGYARAGGHLVIGPRTGYGDREGRVRWSGAGPDRRCGGRLVRRDGFAASAGAGARLPAGHGDRIRRGLTASDAEVLARYQHLHLARWAAVTTRPVGAGRITVVGNVPDQDLAAGLVWWRTAGGGRVDHR